MPEDKRQICLGCQYPLKTCLCQWVKPILSPINIIVLQHPKEAKHAKNTVKLLSLGISNLTLLKGESAADFGSLADKCTANPERYNLCYPNESSIAIESVANASQSTPSFSKEHSVIFIDASWRKALKMWHLNPWLKKINSWHFANPPENQYKIRRTTQENSLSTLESVAYVLELVTTANCSGLKQLFLQMQTRSFVEHK